jgi:hypothetical protein
MGHRASTGGFLAADALERAPMRIRLPVPFRGALVGRSAIGREMAHGVP